MLSAVVGRVHFNGLVCSKMLRAVVAAAEDVGFTQKDFFGISALLGFQVGLCILLT